MLLDSGEGVVYRMFINRSTRGDDGCCPAHSTEGFGNITLVADTGREMLCFKTEPRVTIICTAAFTRNLVEEDKINIDMT